MKEFENKTVLITGAIGGLGMAQAIAFAEKGANLALNYIDVGTFKEQAEKFISELSDKFKGKYIAYAGDITKENDVEAMVKNVIEDFGRIDVLVNNAGISINSTSWKYPKESWDKVLDVNLNGAFLCSKHVLNYMRERKYGRIICISSVVGITGARGTVAYGATKAGLIGMMKTIAREVCTKGITVNCVAPGYIDAGIMSNVPEEYKNNDVIPSIPMGRLGKAEDIANAVAFLASDAAGYITGEVLRVDGGFAM